MRVALEEARAAARGGRGAGRRRRRARRGEIVARARNRTVRDQDPTAHAETIAISRGERRAGELAARRLHAYVTLEPCAMCAGAIVLARVDRVVFGAWDDKAGMAGSVGDLLRHPRLNHRPEVQGGVRGRASAALLREFFAARRGVGVR